MKQPAGGLPYFMAALDADPARGQYWLSYIDALFQADQLEDARQVLALAQQQGLQGDEVDALALRLEGGTQVAGKPNAEHQHAKEAPPVSSAAPQSQNKPETKPTKPGKSAGKFAPHKGKNPSPQEINTLVGLFNQGRFTEAATLARAMTERFPLHGFGWMVLGAVFKQMGRSADALAPMQKAAALSPGDANAHSNLGATLQDLGRPDEAAVSLRRALQLKPDFAEAHCNLGNTLKYLGRLDEAESSYRRALQIKPDYTEAHSGLGATLQDLGQSDEAAVSLKRALQLKPDFAEAHFNLGNTLKSLGRLDEAESSYRRALQIKPNYAEAHNNLGVTLQNLGRLDEAEASFRQALQIKPDFADAHSNLGITLHDLGRLEDALAHFQQQVRLTPGNAVAQHLIASLTGENTERAPIQYVATVFNSYADKFDTHLQQVLQYDVPEKLVALITRHSPIAEKWRVLDLGCGTGLVGTAIAPFAKQLVGVDLSSKMLEKAHARKLYQRLECLDLLTMMQGEQASSYDLIIAADVFIYLGRLDEIICEIKRLLCPGGVFAFSIETLEALSNVEAVQGDEREYQLKNTGRYAHSAKYLNRLASANDFLIQEMVATQIRTEHGKPVIGYMGLWKS